MLRHIDQLKAGLGTELLDFKNEGTKVNKQASLCNYDLLQQGTTQIFQMSRSHLQILGANRVT